MDDLLALHTLKIEVCEPYEQGTAGGDLLAILDDDFISYADKRASAYGEGGRQDLKKYPDDLITRPSETCESSKIVLGCRNRRGRERERSAELIHCAVFIQPTRNSVQLRAPCAPITNDCSMSAVFDGPEINRPKPGRSKRIRWYACCMVWTI